MTCTLHESQPGEKTYVLAVSGNLGLAAAPALKRELLGAAARGHRRIVADLAAATLVDSTPLGVLLGVNRRLERGGVAFSVVCDDRLRVFVLRMGLDELLPMCPLAPPGAMRPSRAVADVA